MYTATAEIVSVVIALISMWLVIEYGLDVPVTRIFRRWLTSWPDEVTKAQIEAVQRFSATHNPLWNRLWKKTIDMLPGSG